LSTFLPRFVVTALKGGLVDLRIRAFLSTSISLEGGLGGLPLRVSNEGLLRPRVARAQETT